MIIRRLSSRLDWDLSYSDRFRMLLAGLDMELYVRWQY